MTAKTYADLDTWETSNPVPDVWEVCVVNDDGRVKIGNGTTPWASLPFLGAPPIASVVQSSFDVVDAGTT